MSKYTVMGFTKKSNTTIQQTCHNHAKWLLELDVKNLNIHKAVF